MLSLFLRLTKEKLIFFSFSLITPSPTHRQEAATLAPAPGRRTFTPCLSPGANSAIQASKVLGMAQDRCRPRLVGLGSPKQPSQQPPPLSGAGFSCEEAKRSCFPGSTHLVAETVLQTPLKTTGATYLLSALQDSHPPSTTPSQGGSQVCSF